MGVGWGVVIILCLMGWSGWLIVTIYPRDFEVVFVAVALSLYRYIYEYEKVRGRLEEDHVCFSLYLCVKTSIR